MEKGDFPKRRFPYFANVKKTHNSGVWSALRRGFYEKVGRGWLEFDEKINIKITWINES
jgi:hypothetical protein